MTLKLKTILCAALAGFAAMQAQAAAISGLSIDSGNFQWPTQTLLADNEQVSAAVAGDTGHDLKDNRDQGNTFTITQDGVIDLIAINFETFDPSGTANVTFKFFEVASATDPTQVGGLLDSLTFTAADISGLGFSNGDEGTLVFDVTNTAVTAGGTYALQFDTVAGQTGTIIKWRRDNAASYTGGQSFGTTTADDYHFGVYAIPEPASAALVIGFGTLAMLVRRRR